LLHPSPHKWRRILLGGATVAAAVVIGACGSSSSSSSSASSAPSSSSSSAGSSPVAASSGTKICAPKKTIGIVDLIAESPIDYKTDQEAELAANDLGWKYTFIDAGGDVNKAETAVQGFVNQHVDMIIDTSVDSAPIRVGLQAAKSANIPVVELAAGNAPSPLFTAMYNENETTMGRILAQYIVNTVPSAKIGDLSTNLNYAGVLRENAVKAVIAASGGKSTIDQDQQVDLTNPVVNTQKTLTDELTASPNINAVYAVFDNMAAAAASTIHQKGSKAKLFTYFTSPSNLNLMKQGEIAAVADANLPFGAVIAYDQFLKHLKTGAAFDPNALQAAGGLSYRVVSTPNQVFTNSATIAPYLSQWAKLYPCK
jgi:ABC-type sugar transport system substrate-binding protein